MKRQDLIHRIDTIEKALKSYENKNKKVRYYTTPPECIPARFKAKLLCMLKAIKEPDIEGEPLDVPDSDATFEFVDAEMCAPECLDEEEHHEKHEKRPKHGKHHDPDACGATCQPQECDWGKPEPKMREEHRVKKVESPPQDQSCSTSCAPPKCDKSQSVSKTNLHVKYDLPQGHKEEHECGKSCSHMKCGQETRRHDREQREKCWKECESVGTTTKHH